MYAMVAPQMIQADNPLYAVNDVFNAICVTGNMLGDVMFYGKGAEKRQQQAQLYRMWLMQ